MLRFILVPQNAFHYKKTTTNTQPKKQHTPNLINLRKKLTEEFRIMSGCVLVII